MKTPSYVKRDLADYPYNAKYPPTNPSSNKYHGYGTAARECLFYDFAVLGYDLMVKYHGRTYYFMTDTDCVWLSNENFTAMIERYKDGNDLLEHFLIEGTPLIRLIDQLEEYEPF